MTGLPPPNVLTYEGQVAVPFIDRTFPPTSANYQFNVPTIWVDTAHKIPYILVAKPMNVADWVAFGGGSILTETLTGNSGGAVAPTANNINVVGDGVTVNVVGNPATSTLTISATDFAPAYTNVTHAMSPYTVLATDEYISVDCSGGAVTLKFPNAPTANRTWTVKDRTGSAATHNITVTTVGGAVNIDGATSYIIGISYEAIDLIANATPTYEVF